MKKILYFPQMIHKHVTNNRDAH